MTPKVADKDVPLELKKRARRRLLGAIIFFSTAALVLPMLMDEAPPSTIANIELHIPAQEKGYAPPPVLMALPSKPAPSEPVISAEVDSVAPQSVVAPAVASVKSHLPKAAPIAPPVTKHEAISKAVSAKTPPKPAPPLPPVDAKRAQSILEGKPEDGDTGKPSAGAHVVLIGAFANTGNVALIQRKLAEMGIKVYTEVIESPQGKKTRVRAGPFSSKEAAEKAAARMKTIGVGGVVAPKN